MKKGFAPILIIILVIAIIALSAVAVWQLEPKTQPQTTNKNIVSYPTQAECETKTGSGCICMFTKPDTVQSSPDCTGWQPQQTSISDTTANWKTYISKNFSVKAPVDWKQVRPEGNPNEIIDMQKIINKDNYQDIQFTYNTVVGTSPHELITKTSTYTIGSGGYKSWNEVQVEFNGNSVKSNEIVFNDGHWVLFPQMNGTNGADFQLYSKQLPSIDDRKLLLQILTTFKFL